MFDIMVLVIILFVTLTEIIPNACRRNEQKASVATPRLTCAHCSTVQSALSTTFRVPAFAKRSHNMSAFVLCVHEAIVLCS